MSDLCPKTLRYLIQDLADEVRAMRLSDVPARPRMLVIRAVSRRLGILATRIETERAPKSEALGEENCTQCGLQKCIDERICDERAEERYLCIVEARDVRRSAATDETIPSGLRRAYVDGISAVIERLKP